MPSSTNIGRLDAQQEERLRELAPEGTTLYVILRHVSRSGMQRRISVVAIIDGDPYHMDYLVALALERRTNGNGEGIVCHGAGMDMGFELIYSLSQALYGDGYKLSHRWL